MVCALFHFICHNVISMFHSKIKEIMEDTSVFTNLIATLQQLKHSVLGLLFFHIQLLQETPDALPHCITFLLARPGWSCLRCHKVMAEGAGVTPLAARGRREEQTPHVTLRSRGPTNSNQKKDEKGSAQQHFLNNVPCVCVCTYL